ncbi:hypothetical protein [Noviherbaspirillum soli]|uniref:hypothetical protein n=1 Tax=Noviherbaspirillum soli TaxID=1064518 RepID=UPI00188B5F5E|nr:hypothetical protein [Noviherbaspirillum soli]
MSPEANAQQKKVMNKALELQAATGLDEAIHAARDYQLAILDFQKTLNASEENP